MAESKSQEPTPAPGSSGAQSAPGTPAAAAAAETEKVVQEALAQAQASVKEAQAAADSAAAPMVMPDLIDAAGATPTKGIELLSDVDLHVTIELGRTQMLVEDVLKLGEGSVVELDKLAGEPVDVYVNHRLVARGEVLVLNDNFCIRISEIVANIEEQGQEAAQEQPAKTG